MDWDGLFWNLQVRRVSWIIKQEDEIMETKYICPECGGKTFQANALGDTWECEDCQSQFNMDDLLEICDELGDYEAC